jgi:ribosome biogenesis protein NSA1
VRAYSDGALDLGDGVLVRTADNKTQILETVDSVQDELAVGGKSINLTLYDLNTKQAKLKFKNVKPDNLGLEQPIWITDICYANEHVIATATAHHQVRLFDQRASKKPVADVLVGENRVNCIMASKDGNTLIYADSIGNVEKLDARNGLKKCGKFSGNTGSVRSIAMDDNEECLATVGLDRYLRVFDYNSRSVKYKVYLKQKLNCVVFAGSSQEKVKQNGAEEEEDDELWNQIKNAEEQDEEESEEEDEDESPKLKVRKIEQQ